jgi:hypothetical protein
MVVFAGLEPGLSGGEELVTPQGEACGQDAELAAECVEGLAAEDAQDDPGLASAGPSSLVLSAGDYPVGLRPPCGSTSRLRCLLVMGAFRRDSQMGVSGNRAPDLGRTGPERTTRH